MARRLKGSHASEIHLYCATEQTRGFWQSYNEKGLFADVVVSSVLYREVLRPVEDAEILLKRARVLEEWLGTTINALAVGDRHLGRGYSLAGFKHPRSRQSEETSYLQMVAGFVAQIEFWRREFENKRPTLVIDCGKVAALVCRKLNIAYRTIAGSRYKNLHQWAQNEFFENPRIEERFRSLTHTGDANIEAPYYSHMTLRQKFVRDVSLPGVFGQIILALLRHVYWRVRRYEKARVYLPLERIRYFWQRRSDIRQLARLASPLAALQGKQFVYYPLQTEPETSLQQLSPEYFYQLSCIAALSRDLPAGTVLAVKETYEAIGRRPSDFYRQIAEFKNVVLLDMMELGLEVVRQAVATATITGTGGFEGAVMGKPVISFGRHNQYNFLTHVFVVTDESKLKRALHAALNGEIENSTSKGDGARFLKAVCDESFDLRDYDYIHFDRFEPVVVEEAIAALEKSLT
jgi:hypothetical protein